MPCAVSLLCACVDLEIKLSRYYCARVRMACSNHAINWKGSPLTVSSIRDCWIFMFTHTELYYQVHFCNTYAQAKLYTREGLGTSNRNVLAGCHLVSSATTNGDNIHPFWDHSVVLTSVANLGVFSIYGNNKSSCHIFIQLGNKLPTVLLSFYINITKAHLETARETILKSY